MWNWLINMVVSKFKDYVLANWKTTLIGALTWLFAHVIGPKFGIGDAVQQEILKLISDAIMPLALFAKDADKTGTTASALARSKPEPAEPPLTPIPYAPITDAQRPPG